MKSTVERFQAAMQVNGVSFEIFQMTKGGSFKTLKITIAQCVSALKVQLCRAHRQWHGTAWNVSESGSPYHIFRTSKYWLISGKQKEAEACARESESQTSSTEMLLKHFVNKFLTIIYFH